MEKLLTGRIVRKAKNDPGMKIGDKCRICHLWYLENGVLFHGNYGDEYTVTKVTSRCFYSEIKWATGKIIDRTMWSGVSNIEKKDGVWMITVPLYNFQASA